MKLLSKYLRGTPAHPPFVSTAPDPVCTATTKAKQRCKLPAVKGSDRCAVHASRP